ncbi:MAG: PDZ domain-containing protein, partial [Pseudomonadota bacterium]
LVNTVGEVVGINTALKEDSLEVGFALPINTAKKILSVLKREGKVVRSWVGIYIREVTKEHADQEGLGKVSGALVTEVVPGGPADRAGLRENDIIISFDDKQVTDAKELPWMAAVVGVKRSIAIKVLRNGKEQIFTLHTEPMPE